MAQTRFPDIDVPTYQTQLDIYAADLSKLIHPERTPESTIAAINEYLFHTIGFRGNHENYYDPENSYLNRVMDRRTGIPITLCSTYLFLARRLDLPIVGIGMPGHFLCAYQTSGGPIFIDAFDKGMIKTKADCLKYLMPTRDGFKESYLKPISPRRILLRMCANLEIIYTQLSLDEEAERFQRYISALRN